MQKPLRQTDLWEWCASRRCHSALFRCCCSCAHALTGPPFICSSSPHPAGLLSVTEARLQKWSARNPMGSSDLASTIFRMAPRSSSPTPAWDRNSTSLSDLVALPADIPEGTAADRRFSLSAITDVDVPGRRNGGGSDAKPDSLKFLFILLLLLLHFIVITVHCSNFKH